MDAKLKKTKQNETHVGQDTRVWQNPSGFSSFFSENRENILNQILLWSARHKWAEATRNPGKLDFKSQYFKRCFFILVSN